MNSLYFLSRKEGNKVMVLKVNILRFSFLIGDWFFEKFSSKVRFYVIVYCGREGFFWKNLFYKLFNKRIGWFINFCRRWGN